VENPLLVNLFTLTILVGGAYAGMGMIREMFPEARPDRIMILTPYPGATPSEIEKGITRKIEEQIKDIEGVETIESIVSEGMSRIIVELESRYDDIQKAVRDIENAIDSIPQEDFPEEALETTVAEFEPRWPVISVSVYGDLDPRTMKVLGERLREDVLGLPGITDVVLGGTLDDEISIEVAPDQLVKYGVSFMQVAEAVAATSMDLPGGQIKTRASNIAVRTLGEREWGEELRDIIIRATPGGRSVRLSDVARVVDGFEDSEVEGRFGGHPAASVTVYKTPDQDAVRISALVQALVAGGMGQPLKRSWTDRLMAKLSGRDEVAEVYDRAAAERYPPGVKLATHGDLARFVQGRLDLLQRNGLFGLGLVFVSLLIFLHWRVAFWVMVGLLVAMAGTVLAMSLAGHTLNLISMLALIIVIGMLVDDGIIVAENIYAKMEAGLEPRLAAIEGTSEVTWPVIGAVSTTIAAFLPLLFIEGQMGQWMGVLPIIVCIALGVSVIEVLTCMPAHLAHGVAPHEAPAIHTAESPPHNTAGSRLRARMRTMQHLLVERLLNRYYDRLVRVCVRYRYVTMGAFCSAMLMTLGLVAGGHVPFVFLQKMDSETIVANLQMSIGTPMARTREAAAVIEKAAVDLPELKFVFSLVGSQLDDDMVMPTSQSHAAQVFIELGPIEERTRTSEDVLEELRRKTAEIPGVEKLKYTTIQGGPGGAAIQLEVSGDRIEDLRAIATAYKAKLAEFEGVYDITDDFDAGRREVQIELYDSARALGLTTASLATQIRAAFYGFEARKIQRGREDVKIMVRYPEDFRRRVHDVESMHIATPDGASIPFREVARLVEGIGYSTITRKDQRRTVTVLADINEDVTNAQLVIGALTSEFPATLAEYPGVDMQFTGRQEETMKSFGSLRIGFAVACAMIFVILTAIFRSYLQPMIIMAAIPFGLIGAVIGHWLMGYPLTIMSMIGLVALTGIVVNDAIVLVNFINVRIREGGEPFASVVEAARLRLRPIMLTSITTVLGLGPLVLEQSFQARFLIPMAISVSAGLIFATVLTLLAVPALYMIVLDSKALTVRLWRWLLGRPAVATTT
jgi:multidrug efflux pump subunit AcrB